MKTDNTMTAEEQIFFNALVEWDGTTDIDNPKQLTIYKVGGEELFNLCKIYSKAHKSALRKAIEEEIEKPIEGKSMWRMGYEAGLRRGKELTETVTPE